MHICNCKTKFSCLYANKNNYKNTCIQEQMCCTVLQIFTHTHCVFKAPKYVYHVQTNIYFQLPSTMFIFTITASYLFPHSNELNTFTEIMQTIVNGRRLVLATAFAQIIFILLKIEFNFLVALILTLCWRKLFHKLLNYHFKKSSHCIFPKLIWTKLFRQI